MRKIYLVDIYNNFEILPEDCQGWNGKSVIFELLIKQINPKIIVEVGSWKGQSTITMGKIIQKYNINCKILCIDTWLGALEFITNERFSPERSLRSKNGYPQIYYQFLSNVVHNNLQNIITPIPNTSVIGFKYLKYFNIIPDLIYIDASHEEDDVYIDIKNYFSILSDEGIIFGDDFTDYWPGVKNAVSKFCEEKNLKYEIFENNFWIIRK